MKFLPLHDCLIVKRIEAGETRVGGATEVEVKEKKHPAPAMPAGGMDY